MEVYMNKIIKYICGGLVLASACIYLIIGCNDHKVPELVQDESTTVFEGVSGAPGKTDGEGAQETSSRMCVYVCGQVMQSGVFYFEEGARVYEAIEAAGGITEKGDASAVNQADILSDGQMIYVPEKGENASVSGQGTGALININTADKTALMTLSGIGESRASDIISYRESNGAYTCIEDIMNVPGIKEAAFNKIKDHICVK